MKHAGVAVSVTTFTDVIAFFVGSNTLLPGLKSFCVYAAVAIFCIYALQVTHFVAWFSLGKFSRFCLCLSELFQTKEDRILKETVVSVAINTRI